MFSSKNFLKLCHRNSLDQLVHRLEKKEFIRRIGNGIYDYPRIDLESGLYLNPRIEDVVKALEIKFNEKLQYNGKTALKMLGFGDLVVIPYEPVLAENNEKFCYLTNGRSKKIKVLNYEINIIRTNIPTPAKKDDIVTLVMQGIIYLGEDYFKSKDGIQTLNKLLAKLNEKQLNKFKKLIKFAPKWVSNLMHNTKAD